MILSKSKQYFLIKKIDGEIYHLSLVSFTFICGIQGAIGCNSKEDLQFYINKNKIDLIDTKIASIIVTEELTEE